MRLLLDENLPRSLVSLLGDLFPDSTSVFHLGLSGCSDQAVWAAAKESGLVIATKDSDFVDRLLLDGCPPKVVWLRVGNCPIRQVELVFRGNLGLLRELDESEEYSLLVLPSGLLL